MGWFRDMVTGQATLHEQQMRLDNITAEYNDARRERQDAINEQARCRETMKFQAGELERLRDELAKVTMQAEHCAAQKHLLTRLLEDARHRELRHAELTERVIIVERHNATAQASNQWAIAHINMLTTERAALLAPRGVTMPVPELQWKDDPEVANWRSARGAPTQPFDTIDPPAGPIQKGPSILGVPIPDGKTAGDVLEKLREARDAAEAEVPTSPEELLRAATDIFSDLPYEPPSDAPTTPFAE